jgi:hypothetical protein
VSSLTPVERTERRRQQRRRELIRWGIRILIVLVVFLLGVALGQAIQDNPKTGRTVTSDRTIRLPTAGNLGSTITP